MQKHGEPELEVDVSHTGEKVLDLLMKNLMKKYCAILGEMVNKISLEENKNWHSVLYVDKEIIFLETNLSTIAENDVSSSI